MPLPIIAQGVEGGISSIPYAIPILKTIPWLVALVLLKIYFGGARNTSERLMHSKVVMVTGGTSGIGAQVVQELATRGAQIILLTRQPPSDPFLVDYIEDLRSSTNNELIYAEQVDLSSLLSIRAFATKWVDNAPPRRLDMIILCAGVMTPSRVKKLPTIDGLDEEWQVNYLANYHLLSILSPALRAQPGDRDVRIIISTCSSYIGATLNRNDTVPDPDQQEQKQKPKPTPQLPQVEQRQSSMYATSKLSLMIFAQSFQKHLDTYKRPDKQPNNARVLLVDPGFCRTPGTRRWLTGGSLWGLLAYLLTWPFWWLILKSPQQGAQNFLLAAMEAALGAVGGRVATSMSSGATDAKEVGTAVGDVILLKECKERKFLRREVTDDRAGKELWEFSQTQIEAVETEAAIRRTREKKEKEEVEKSEKEAAKKQGGKTRTPGSRRDRKGK
ncbi:hypothetical protein FQN54_006066 [Arachnomyces sp. PD_36]|nr:hypothetical protein FQN54_006066 [Arachnomyces sp. PD_36]